MESSRNIFQTINQLFEIFEKKGNRDIGEPLHKEIRHELIRKSETVLYQQVIMPVRRKLSIDVDEISNK